MLIRVTQLVETRDLDHDDQQDLPAGEDGKGSVHDYEVPEHYRDEEEALDWFHDHVGIACLEDFEIQVLDTCTGCKELTWAGGEDGLCGDCLNARDQHYLRMTDDPIYAAGVREREQAERERDRGEWTEHYGAD